MTLRTRIVAYVALVTLIFSALAFAGVYRLIIAMDQRRLDDALRSLAAEEANHLATRGFTFGPSPDVDVEESGPLLKHGAVYDEAGSILAYVHFDRAPPQFDSIPSKKVDVPFDFDFRGEPMRGMLSPIPGQQSKRLLMAVSRADVEGDKVFLARAMIVALLFNVIWVVLLVHRVVGRFVVGHEQLADAARRVAAGDLTVRIGQQVKDPEIAQLAIDFDDMVDRLDVLMRSQQQFVAHAAHELRSPLTTLYGELQLALRRERSVEAYRECVRECLESTERLKMLAEDLLTLARLGGERTETMETVFISDVVQAAFREVGTLAGERQVELDVQEASAYVTGHARDLGRLLRNLLENAIRHTKVKGRVLVRVIVEPPQVVRIVISDEGPGVAEEDRARVFEAFFRSAQTRASHYEGTGLGLAICREIARAHRGDLALVSPTPSDLAGACFEVLLPLVGFDRVSRLPSSLPSVG